MNYLEITIVLSVFLLASVVLNFFWRAQVRSADEAAEYWLARYEERHAEWVDRGVMQRKAEGLLDLATKQLIHGTMCAAQLRDDENLPPSVTVEIDPAHIKGKCLGCDVFLTFRKPDGWAKKP